MSRRRVNPTQQDVMRALRRQPQRLRDLADGSANWQKRQPISALLDEMEAAGLVRRVLKAMDRHARESLTAAQMQSIDTESELTWRLARREVYDALSALVQASGRALAEPLAGNRDLVGVDDQRRRRPARPAFGQDPDDFETVEGPDCGQQRHGQRQLSQIPGRAFRRRRRQGRPRH